MKRLSPGLLAAGVVVITGLTLVAVGTPGTRPPAPIVAPTSAPAPPASIANGGITLASSAIDLPADDAVLPAGAHSDLVTATCTACHSANMMLTQPPLTQQQWTATVTKMREVYKAPVADGDVAAIVAYLGSLPGQRPTGPTGG